jgi:hypothetical protein
MLPESESIALGASKHCSWHLKALLLPYKRKTEAIRVDDFRFL